MFFSLFFISLFTRFFGLGWGNGFFFHPDENNMAVALSQLSPANLNPHFFAYGQFPLYLGYFILNLFHFQNTFTNSVLVLRFFSAIFSMFSIYIFYLISKNKIATLLFIFTPGLIQLAHFGTTESLLILVFLLEIYLSLKIYKNPKIKYYLLATLIGGIGIATKISALFFLIPILLANPKKIHLFILTSLFSLVISLLFSPYNLIAQDEFLSSMIYETQVATGAVKVFYTTQFQNTTPYLFQFTHIFPYIAGLPMFVLAIFSFFRKPKNYLVLLPCLIYFLYFGQVYVKWTRFMSPIFFIFPLLAGYFLSNLKNKFIKYILLTICIIPGMIFFSQYFRPDIRIVTSDWMDKNISKSSMVLSESGNVVNLPPANTFFDFYSQVPPENISNYDYIIIPSRRVFKNNIAPTYYQNLFSGQSGFKLEKQFLPPSEFFLNSENAEETWSVFDRPTIRIFQNYELLINVK